MASFRPVGLDVTITTIAMYPAIAHFINTRFGALPPWVVCHHRTFLAGYPSFS